MDKFIKIEETESTNSYLKKNLDNYKAPLLLYAGKQTAGKGRYERKWVSVPGKDLTFSLLIASDKSHCNIWQNISQVTSLAICELLEEMNLKPQIKWPNDILVFDKKICGILVEAIQKQNSELYHLIVGIGLNVNSSKDELSVIDQPACSVFSETGRVVNHHDLLREIYEKIILYNKILHSHGFLPFKIEVESRLAYIGKRKIITDGTKKHIGKLSRLNDDGTLQFKTESGDIIKINSGEIRFAKD